MTNNKLTDERLNVLATDLAACGFGWFGHEVQAMALEIISYRTAKAEEGAGGVLPYSIAQKFKRGWRVKITSELPESMSHFTCDCEAIVLFSYAQRYFGNDFDSYCLLLLEDGVPPRSCAWYEADQLTLVSDDVLAGLEVIKGTENDN